MELESNNYTEKQKRRLPTAKASKYQPFAAIQLFNDNRGEKIGLVGKFKRILRDFLCEARRRYLAGVFGMDLHPTCKISLKANLDKTNPKGVHVGAGTYIAFDVVVLAHDMSRLVHMHTTVGKNCFIGARAIIMPGVNVGDECIVGTGSVVTRDVPPNSICVGNPAVVVKQGIQTREHGILKEVYEFALASTRRA